MSEQQLRTCPFCGGIAKSRTANRDYDETFYYIKCTRCSAESGAYEYREDAVNAWNVRIDGRPYEQIRGAENDH